MSALQLPFLHPEHPFRERFEAFLKEHGLDFTTWPALREQDETRAEAIAEAFGTYLLENVLPNIHFLAFKKPEHNLLVGIALNKESAELIAYEFSQDNALEIENLSQAVRVFQSVKLLTHSRVEQIYEWLEEGGRPVEKAFFDTLLKHVPKQD